jgi:hypothetical protein
MNKKLLTLAIAVFILAIIAAPVAARMPGKNPWPPSNPCYNVWALLQDLQNQINALTTKVNSIPPGQQGPPGPTGPAGAAGATGPTGPAGKDGAGATVHFGDWDTTSYVKTTKYTATTDGFVVGTGACDGTTTCSLHEIAKFDSIGDPALGFDDRVDIIPGSQVALTMPVKAGDTWGVWAGSDVTVHIRWIPLSA